MVEGIDDWRLPEAVEIDINCSTQVPGAGISTGYNCAESEMANLFYRALGGTAHTAINGDYGPFLNIENGYWYSTTYKNDPTGYAWAFGFGDGSQNIRAMGDVANLWPVRDGDVPVPGSLALIGLGLVAWAGSRRRRRV